MEVATPLRGDEEPYGYADQWEVAWKLLPLLGAMRNHQETLSELRKRSGCYPS